MIIYRCLIKEILTVAAFITGLLIIVFIGIQLANFLSSSLASSLVSSVLVEFVVLQIPLLLTELLPLGIFLAILLVYGRWYADSEMIILFASGFSHARLLIFTFFLGITIAVFSGILSFWLTPHIAARQQKLIARMSAEFALKKIVPQQFQSIGNVVYYVDEVGKDQRTMKNIFFLQTQKNGKTVLILAKTGETQVADNSKKSMILAKDGYRYEFTPGQKNIVMTHYDTYGQQIISSVDSNGNTIATNEMATSDLIHKNGFLGSNSAYAAELQWRISLPIALILLSLLAAPLSYVNPRHGRFSHLLPAILIAIIYVNLLYTCQTWIANNTIPVWIGVWWIHLLLLGLVIYFVGKWSDFHFVKTTLKRIKV
jgi:lipopolysaccharide export system permease protein